MDEGRAHFGGGAEAVSGFFEQGSHDHSVEVDGHTAHADRHRGRDRREVGADGVFDARTHERRLADEREVQQSAHLVEVSGGADGVATQLLG